MLAIFWREKKSSNTHSAFILTIYTPIYYISISPYTFIFSSTLMGLGLRWGFLLMFKFLYKKE